MNHFSQLSDDELAERATEWIFKLCSSGGREWVMRVPPDGDHDPDLIFSELVERFNLMREGRR